MPRIPGRRMHFHIPVQRHLNGNVGGGAKSVKAQLAAGLNSRKTQGAKPDDSGAEQRSGLLIGKLLRDGIDKVLWSNNVLGVAPVYGIADRKSTRLNSSHQIISY